MESLATKLLLWTQDLPLLPEESLVILNRGEFNTSLVHEPTPGPLCEIGAEW